MDGWMDFRPAPSHARQLKIVANHCETAAYGLEQRSCYTYTQRAVDSNVNGFYYHHASTSAANS